MTNNTAQNIISAINNNTKEAISMTTTIITNISRRVSISMVIILVTLAAITLSVFGVGKDSMPTQEAISQEVQIVSLRTDGEQIRYERVNNDRSFWAGHIAEQYEYLGF